MNKMEWNKIIIDEETGNLENLPEEGEYIFSFKNGTVMVDELGWTDSENGYGVYLASGYDPADLTAWMPLPEPYPNTEKISGEEIMRRRDRCAYCYDRIKKDGREVCSRYNNTDTYKIKSCNNKR